MTITSRRSLSLLFIAIAIGTASYEALTISARRAEPFQAPAQDRPVDRTTARLNAMTASQRDHARLHAQDNGARTTGKRLLDHKISLMPHTEYGPPTNLKTARNAMTSSYCAADAVFIGHIAKKESFPTEDGLFLFTDHAVTISEILKAPKGVALAEPTVIVSRPGGELNVEGVPVTATVDSLRFLKDGATYLFLVDFVPAHRTFVGRKSSSIWEIEAGRARALAAQSISDVNAVSTGIDANELKSWFQGASCR
jgi:hypothetical protein